MDCSGRRKGAQALLVRGVPPCGRDSSAPLLVRRGVAPSFPFSLTSVRERSAEMALLLSLAPRRRCRVPLRGTPPPGAPLWRLPPRDRLVGSEPGTFTPVIRAAFAALHPDRTGLLAKAALRSKGGREPRATRTSVRVHRSAGATPAPSTKTPLEDALTEQACRQYRRLRNGTRLIRIPVFVRWGRSVRSLGMELARRRMPADMRRQLIHEGGIMRQ